MLTQAGMRVWLDESELRLGDSLRAKIDEGLAHSRFGVVILSASFFAKDWPQRELGALFSRRDALLPVWHGVTAADVASRSPLLADIVATSTSHGLPAVASKIIDVVHTARQQSGQGSACTCTETYQYVYEQVVEAAARLPEAISQYVMHVAGALRGVAGDIGVCCTFRRTALRCAHTLRRLTSSLSAAFLTFERAKLLNDREVDSLHARVVMYRSRIADWCSNVERVIEQRRKQLLLHQLANDAGIDAEDAGWMLSVIEDILDAYASDVLASNGPPSFVLLLDPQEQVVTRHGESLFLVPTTSLADLAALVTELWHHVGRHAFLLRYDLAKFRTSKGRRRGKLRNDELEPFWDDISAIYADVTMLAYAFGYDLYGMTRAVSSALFRSTMFREAAVPTRERYILRLLFRLYFPAEFVFLAMSSSNHSQPQWRRSSDGNIALPHAELIIQELVALVERVVPTEMGISKLPSSFISVTARNVTGDTSIEMRRVIHQLFDVLPHHREAMASELDVLARKQHGFDELTPTLANGMIARIAAGHGNVDSAADGNRELSTTNTLTMNVLRAVRAHIINNRPEVKRDTA
jgi:hypothetical protein